MCRPLIKKDVFFKKMTLYFSLHWGGTQGGREPATPNVYEARISLMCSNMEQIITLIGNVMDKLSQSARVVQKTQLAHL